MSYTVGKAWGQIDLRINGGKPSLESSVRRVDIMPYLAAAVSEVNGFDRNELWLKSWRAKRAGMAFSGVPDYNIYITLPETVAWDTTACLPYITLPLTPISTDGELTYQVMPAKGWGGYIKINDPDEIMGIREETSLTTYYWHERSRANVIKVFFTDNIMVDTAVQVKIIADTASLTDDDILPVPADREALVIEKAYQFFTGERLFPSDIIINQRDDKDARTGQH